MKTSEEGQKELSINKRINVNATFHNVGIFHFCKEAEIALKSSGLSAKEWILKMYSRHEDLTGCQFVMASKKMRRAGRLIGVGRYLFNEK